MVDINELKLRTSEFIDAYQSVETAMKVGRENGVLIAEAQLGDDYRLVAALNSDLYVITTDDYKPVFIYVPEDQFTIGDLIGGYLDLCFGEAH